MYINFTEKEYQFIENEFGYDKEQVNDMSDNELYNLFDECFVIEEKETVAAGENDLSDRGKTAADIVTKINE